MPSGPCCPSCSISTGQQAGYRRCLGHIRGRQDGRTKATDNEVYAVFELLLDQLKFTYLVFDALDECADPRELVSA